MHTKQKLEVKNDKLFEAQNQLDQMKDDGRKLQKENEKNLDRKMTQLNKQYRNDIDSYKSNLNERRNLKVRQIREDL